MHSEFRIGFFVTLALILLIGCKEETVPLGPYPDAGLISYFPFDGNINDVMGNSTGGINHNFATFSDGKFGDAITFNGVDEYLDYTARTYNSQSNISVSLWCNVKFNTGGTPLIKAGEFYLSITIGDVRFGISHPNTSYASGGVIEDAWIHVAGTYDGSHIRLYVNGILKESTEWPGTITTPGEPLTIGKHNNEFLNGRIDELFIYQRQLSSEEVNMLYER